jgi:adenylate cyclase
VSRVTERSPRDGRGAAEILTFLIADVRGYTAFTQAHGDEAAGRLAATFAQIAREGVEARDGEVIELRGDEALAVFSSARQAIRAAVELQEVFTKTEWDRYLPGRPYSKVCPGV